MAGTSSILCAVAEFGFSDIKPSRFPATASVIYLVTQLVVEPHGLTSLIHFTPLAQEPQ